MSVSLVARQHGIAPNQLFTWRRLYAEGALSAVGSGEEVVPASEYRVPTANLGESPRVTSHDNTTIMTQTKIGLAVRCSDY
jgi:transposase